MANRKEPTMKLTSLIWVLALASAIVACNSGVPIECSPGEVVDLDDDSPTYGRCIPAEDSTAASVVDSAAADGATKGPCTMDADAGCTP